MAKFWLGAAIGFYLLQLCLAEIGLNISCRYAGVFHVEKNRRYSLTREEATTLCEALNSTIPTMEQMQKAYDLGFETCRYGYIQEKIVIPRQKPYYLCAANNTGIYILASNISDQYDTYCFNASETRPVACEPVIKLYSVWPNDQSIIDISNADGSRYIGGKKYTERPPVVRDDDSIVGSGTANESGTTDPTVLRTSDDFTRFADDVTRVSPYDGDDEDSTPGPGIHDDRTGQDGSRDHSSKTDRKDENRKSEGQDQDLLEESSNSQPRWARIPDWLIVVASLMALALILGVCIAVNSRRRCGQKQKLVINNGKGAVDGKNMGGLNGEASKSQEMTHLVNTELSEDRTGPHDEFLAVDETQNQQDMDLKTGV